MDNKEEIRAFFKQWCKDNDQKRGLAMEEAIPLKKIILKKPCVLQGV